MLVRRSRPIVVVVAALLAVALIMPTAAGAAGKGLQKGDRAVLLDYARTTWASFVAMTDATSGLPADTLHFDGTRSVQTSTTNIGAYLWSTLVADELGLITHAQAVARLTQTITTLERMERDEASGQYYNWYDHRTGAKLTVWPPSGETVTPILSSVDNGWLANGLHLVRNSVPEVAARADALFQSMDFGVYYVPGRNLIRFHINPEAPEDPVKSPCCYDTIVSESRIASYIGIAKGELPDRHYFGHWRTFPETCDWNWHETQPVGFRATYLGVNVYEGAYPYEDFRVVPGWGGSMFEALMPNLFVPEETWGPESWAINHPLTVTAQIHHGLEEAGYGYWGFSPANVPEGGYTEYGVDAIGMRPDGYKSNNDNTLVDRGFGDCPGRPAMPDPPQSAYTNGVVTPHAAFLALRYAPGMTLENLANLREDFDIYTPWGFRDSVNVDTGRVSDYYLSLDQGIIMGAIGNALAGDMLRKAWATESFRNTLQPIISLETFNAGPRRAASGLR